MTAARARSMRGERGCIACLVSLKREGVICRGCASSLANVRQGLTPRSPVLLSRGSEVSGESPPPPSRWPGCSSSTGSPGSAPAGAGDTGWACRPQPKALPVGGKPPHESVRADTSRGGAETFRFFKQQRDAGVLIAMAELCQPQFGQVVAVALHGLGADRALC